MNPDSTYFQPAYDGTDTDCDGLCDAGDLCSDVTATNWNDPGNGACAYPEASFTCGDLLAFAGHNYQTVEIGTQCWFAENLRSTHYSDESEIPSGLTDAEWVATSDTSLGASAVYGEGTSSCTGDCDEETNLTNFGRLYNWHAVITGLLCPEGWGVPTDADWGILENEVYSPNFSFGEVLKSTSWNGTDFFGFNGLPGGYRGPSESFTGQGVNGLFWSSTQTSSYAWYRGFYADYGVFKDLALPEAAFSIRCIQD